MGLGFNLFIQKKDLSIDCLCDQVFLDVETAGHRVIVLGNPVHIQSDSAEELLMQGLKADDISSSLFDYFGEFYVVRVGDVCVEIIASSSTHGFYFVDRGDDYVVSTELNECAKHKGEARIEECFLYVVQNINLDPFHTLYEGVNHVPGLCSARFGKFNASISSIPIPIQEESSAIALPKIIDDFGRQSQKIYENPVFAVSAGIDGVLLAAAHGIHNKKLRLVNGYQSEYEKGVIDRFSNRVMGLGVDVESWFFSDSSYSDKFTDFYKKPVKSNWIAEGYKLRCIDNGVQSWQEYTTIVNGYGIDESYEWFRPMGVAYTSVDADSLFYSIDYFLSRQYYRLRELCAKGRGLTQVFETSKIYVSSAAELFGLKDVYNEMILNRLARILKVASGDSYNYSLDEKLSDDTLSLFTDMSATERFLAHYYFANSAHLTRFSNIFSNPVVGSSQPWEFMPFVKALANLENNDRSYFRPKKLLFDYLEDNGLSYVDILKEARRGSLYSAPGYRSLLLYRAAKSAARKGFATKTKRNKLFSSGERQMITQLLANSNFRPQSCDGISAKIKKYFDYLERSITDPSFETCANEHELRNFVHLCHMMSD